jgi:hypothetical protein
MGVRDDKTRIVLNNLISQRLAFFQRQFIECYDRKNPSERELVELNEKIKEAQIDYENAQHLRDIKFESYCKFVQEIGGR